MIVDLPWPNKGLSQNARIHHMQRARLVKIYRDLAAILTREVLGRSKFEASAVCLRVVFCPPDWRRRDKSNCIGMFKAYEDGIADALGVDDSNFENTYLMGDPVKGGKVRVHISQSEADTWQRIGEVLSK